MERLFDGTGPKGAMGAVRQRLLRHLQLPHEEDLRPILERLQIDMSRNSLERLREELWRDLSAAGLLQMDLSARTDGYSQLPWRLHQDNIEWHTADSLRGVAQQEGIWVGTPTPDGRRLRLGVRSFMRWAEDMEVKTDAMLCLVTHFLGRRIRDPRLWHDDILPSVQQFVRRHVTRGSRVELDVQSLCSVAFLLGHLIEPKLGADIAILQGGEPWTIRPSLLGSIKQSWSIVQQDLEAGGTDLVLAISVTRDVTPAVRGFVAECIRSACKLVEASPISGPSVRAIEHGTQALAMAEQLVTAVRAIRTAQKIQGRIHVFLSAPNAFSFFLGQVFRPLGAVQMYEYNFEQPEGCEYWPSLALAPSISI
jgi:hypothetical protein